MARPQQWRTIRNWITRILVLGLVIVLFWFLNRTIPNQHLPWRPLDPEAPIGLATKGQLLRLSVSSSQTCMDLARSIESLNSIPSEPRQATPPCGWDSARLVYGGAGAELAPGEANMQCPLSIASYLWLREVDQIAQKRFKQPLARVHHMGSFSCRRQRGNSSNRWSEHAFANAWDIAAFELQDGRIIRVLSHWDDGNRKERAFLRNVRDEACRIFNVTLSPDFNDAHRDHFHVDMGPSSSCQ